MKFYSFFKRSVVVMIMILASKLSAPLWGMEKILNPKTDSLDQSVAIADCRFLTTGPYREIGASKDGDQFYYRVGWLLSEIYYLITLEKIVTSYSVNSEGERHTQWTYVLDGEDIAQELKIKGEAITDIQFVKWKDWDTFILKIHGKETEFKVIEPTKAGSVKLKIQERKKG